MSTPSNSRTVVVTALSAGLVLLTLLFWRQHMELQLCRQDNARLTEQTRLLQPGAGASATGTAVAPALSVRSRPDGSAGNNTAAPAPGTGVAAGASSTAPVVLGAIEVKPLANPAYPEGLLAILPLARNKAEPLGVVHIFVRLPKNSSDRMIDINPSDAAGYTNMRKYVKADGKFAAFEGTPTTAGAPQLELSVSTSVNIDLRGACETGAIGPYQVEITPTGATVR